MSRDNLPPNTSRHASGRGRQWATLVRRADFLRVGAAGLKRVAPGFVLQAAPREGTGEGLRIGFTASRKVGNAVARNRAKRRLRALADRLIPQVADPTFDYVLIGRTEIIKRDFTVLENELRDALRRISTARPKGRSQ